MLRFRVFGVPVSVHPLFWFIAVILGLNIPKGDTWLSELGLWVGIVFFGVLAHELGHALSALAFGQAPSIVLHSMGGTTMWRELPPTPSAERFGLKPTPQITPGKRILISFAGPFVGIVLGVVSIVVASIVHAPQDSALARVMADLVWVNLGWGVLNLVPMLPLDGGNIVASVAELVVPSRRHARIAAHGLSVLVAVGLGVLVLTYARSAWNVMLVALLGWQNVVALRALLSPPEDPPGGGRPSGGPGPGRSPGGEAGGPPQGPDFH